MAELDYDTMARVLTRCAEIADAPTAKTSVKTTYLGILEVPAETFLAATRALTRAGSDYAKQSSEAMAALLAFDRPFREARSVVKAFIPTANVPATLKQLTTDTDRLNAIESLLLVIEEHQSLQWASELLSGEFGTKANLTMGEIGESIAASVTLNNARKARALAFDQAYHAYLRFKRVVRDSLGSTSLEYKRIHIRAAPTLDVDAEPLSAPT